MSTIKSKENTAYDVQSDDLFPMVDNVGDTPQSVIPDQILRALFDSKTLFVGTKRQFQTVSAAVDFAIANDLHIPDPSDIKTLATVTFTQNSYIVSGTFATAFITKDSFIRVQGAGNPWYSVDFFGTSGSTELYLKTPYQEVGSTVTIEITEPKPVRIMIAPGTYGTQGVPTAADWDVVRFGGVDGFFSFEGIERSGWVHNIHFAIAELNSGLFQVSNLTGMGHLLTDWANFGPSLHMRVVVSMRNVDWTTVNSIDLMGGPGAKKGAIILIDCEFHYLGDVNLDNSSYIYMRNVNFDARWQDPIEYAITFLNIGSPSIADGGGRRLDLFNVTYTSQASGTTFAVGTASVGLVIEPVGVEANLHDVTLLPSVAGSATGTHSYGLAVKGTNAVVNIYGGNIRPYDADVAANFAHIVTQLGTGTLNIYSNQGYIVVDESGGGWVVNEFNEQILGVINSVQVAGGSGATKVGEIVVPPGIFTNSKKPVLEFEVIVTSDGTPANDVTLLITPSTSFPTLDVVDADFGNGILTPSLFRKGRIIGVNSGSFLAFPDKAALTSDGVLSGSSIAGADFEPGFNMEVWITPDATNTINLQYFKLTLVDRG